MSKIQYGYSTEYNVYSVLFPFPYAFKYQILKTLNFQIHGVALLFTYPSSSTNNFIARNMSSHLQGYQLDYTCDVDYSGYIIGMTCEIKYYIE